MHFKNKFTLFENCIPYAREYLYTHIYIEVREMPITSKEKFSSKE